MTVTYKQFADMSMCSLGWHAGTITLWL